MDYEIVAKRFHLRFKFDKLHKYYGEMDRIVVLDVGAGNHSASIFKKYYPNSYYVGIDKDSNYVQSKRDFSAMDEFFMIDLEQESIEQQIGEKEFDLIIMSHIIEHLSNGDKVISNLFGHLKENGRIYIEWPSEKSLLLPKGKFPTLNFYDDDTHVRVYPLYEICNLLKCGGGGILRRRKTET